MLRQARRWASLATPPSDTWPQEWWRTPRPSSQTSAATCRWRTPLHVCYRRDNALRGVIPPQKKEIGSRLGYPPPVKPSRRTLALGYPHRGIIVARVGTTPLAVKVTSNRARLLTARCVPTLATMMPCRG
eukprot:583744-Prorocentrum_minimum.AAC.2